MDYVRLPVIVPALRVLILAPVECLALQIVLLLVIPTASIVVKYALNFQVVGGPLMKGTGRSGLAVASVIAIAIIVANNYGK